MRVLFFGEIVSKAGIFTYKKTLPVLKEKYKPDFIVANGNGVTGGFGMGKNHSLYLRKLGLQCITSGECVYYKKDMVPHIQKSSFLLRGANYPPGNPGRGWGVYTLENGMEIGVINLVGLSGYSRLHLSNPYSYAPDIIKKIKQRTNIVLLNYHATTTAEKQTMLYNVDGSLSAVIGTGTRALSSDMEVTEKGTAYISDAGRTGSLISVGGLKAEVEIRKMLTQIPERSEDSWDGLEAQGVYLEIDNSSGKTIKAESFREICQEVPDDANRKNM